jgi:hypothetical protein
MKKRRMTKKSRVRTSRKRMGAVAGGTADTLKQALFIVGGMAASKLIVNAIGKVAPTILGTPVAKAGGQIVLGLITKPLASAVGVKSSNINSLGTGMIVGGSYELVKTFAPKVLGQMDEQGDVVIISGQDEIGGSMDLSELNGTMDLSELNGLDEIGEMFEIGY